MFKQWQRDKREDILGYRNRSYRSTITGTLAPPHHTRWMEAMDDSLQAFLDEPRALEEQPRVPALPTPVAAAAEGFAEPVRRRA